MSSVEFISGTGSFREPLIRSATARVRGWVTCGSNESGCYTRAEDTCLCATLGAVALTRNGPGTLRCRNLRSSSEY